MKCCFFHVFCVYQCESMEFGSTANDTSLRNRLRRLATIAQLQCTELDRARLNVLVETKNSVHNPHKKRDNTFSFGRTRFIQEARPQSTIFLGGGPAGLLGGKYLYICVFYKPFLF
jgi:hypothetical protein